MTDGLAVVDGDAVLVGVCDDVEDDDAVDVGLADGAKRTMGTVWIAALVSVAPPTTQPAALVSTTVAPDMRAASDGVAAR